MKYFRCSICHYKIHERKYKNENQTWCPNCKLFSYYYVCEHTPYFIRLFLTIKWLIIAIQTEIKGEHNGKN